MRISGWRAAVALLAGLLVVCLLVVAFFWIGVLLAALAVVGWFNLVLLPRVSLRLRMPQVVVASALLPLLGAVGFVFGGLTGALAACCVWAIAVALPRAVVWRLRRRQLLQRQSDAAPPTRPVRVIDATFRV